MSLRRCAAPLLILAAFSGCEQQHAPPPPAPAEVNIVRVERRDEPIAQEWIGTLAGYVDADIRAQVTGYLRRQAYAEGARVRKGDLLFQIDPRPFAAALAQVQATEERARADLAREKTLIQRNAVSQQDYDNALAAEKSAAAALQTAQLNLDFTSITSPIDGVAGIARAQIGDLVGPGTGVLTTVSTLDPIKVYFPISEQTYLQFQRGGPGQPHPLDGLPLELVLSDGTRYPRAGKVIAADRQIDPSTGTLQLVGVFPNPDNLLRPGQYARVRAVVRQESGVLEVPERAVQELQGAYQIDTVDERHRAHVVPVEVGERVGGRWIVRQGLQAGDWVIVDGVQKVRDGAAVNPHPATP